MIESLFGYNVKNSTTDDKAKSNSPSPSKHVLDPKRLQNITILSKALNITAEQVCHALLLGLRVPYASQNISCSMFARLKSNMSEKCRDWFEFTAAGGIGKDGSHH